MNSISQNLGIKNANQCNNKVLEPFRDPKSEVKSENNRFSDRHECDNKVFALVRGFCTSAEGTSAKTEDECKNLVVARVSIRKPTFQILPHFLGRVYPQGSLLKCVCINITIEFRILSSTRDHFLWLTCFLVHFRKLIF